MLSGPLEDTCLVSADFQSWHFPRGEACGWTDINNLFRSLGVQSKEVTSVAHVNRPFRYLAMVAAGLLPPGNKRLYG